jgi:very-short-patch-repair endonuclease
MPGSADLLARYIRHFDSTFRVEQSPPAVDGVQSAPSQEHWHWTYDRERCESEFERRVAEFLENFSRVHQVKLFNQVTCCGQKRLDFVLFHGKTEACIAVEVDGQDHYSVNGRSYSEAHMDRVDILRRAGWKILHIPYYAWYKNGWICDRAEPQFRQMIDRLTAELRSLLGL